MGKYLVRRLGAAFVVMLLVSIITFIALSVIPGNAALIALGTEASAASLDAVSSDLGLDQSFSSRLLSYYKGLLSLDFGTSSYFGQDVWTLILQRLPLTVSLALLSLLAAFILSMLLGCAAAIYRGSFIDAFSRIIVQLSASVPSFWLSLLLLLFASRVLGFSQAGSYVSMSESIPLFLKSISLAVIVLAVGESGPLLRIVRISMIGAMEEDWFTACQVKGLSKRKAVFSYALRRALSAPVSLMGLQLAKLLGGTAIVESIFALPGLGRLFLTAVEMRDLNLVQGIVIFVSFAVVMMNLLTDLLLRAVINPLSASEDRK